MRVSLSKFCGGLSLSVFLGLLLSATGCKTTAPTSSGVSSAGVVGDTKACDETSKRARTDDEIKKVLVELMHGSGELRPAVAICLGGLFFHLNSDTPATDAQRAAGGPGKEDAIFVKLANDPNAANTLVKLAVASYSGQDIKSTLDRVTEGLVAFKVGQAALTSLMPDTGASNEADMALNTLATNFLNAIADSRREFAVLKVIAVDLSAIEKAIATGDSALITQALNSVNSTLSSDRVLTKDAKQNIAAMVGQMVGFFEIKNPNFNAQTSLGAPVTALAKAAGLAADAPQFLAQSRLAATEAILVPANAVVSSGEVSEGVRANYNQLVSNANRIANQAKSSLATAALAAANVTISALAQSASNNQSGNGAAQVRSAPVFEQLRSQFVSNLNYSGKIAAVTKKAKM